MKKEHFIAGAVARKRRASVFLMSVMTVLICSIAVIGWLSYITETQRQANRDRARVNAFMAAESGVEMVIDWFNHSGYFDVAGNYPGDIPEAYTDGGFQNSPYPAPCSDFAGYVYGLFEPYVLTVHTEGKFDTSGSPPVWNESVQRDASGHPVRTLVTWFRPDKSSKIPSCELLPQDEDQPWVTFAENGVTRATLLKIAVINPSDFGTLGEAAPASPSRVICKVIAEATAPELDGATIRVETLVRENPLLSISSPGAIITGIAAEYNGQYNIHWGELWAQKSIELPSNFSGKIPEPKDDPWVRIRTIDYLRDSGGTQYADGHITGGFGTSPITNTTDVNYEVPYFQIDDTKDNKLIPYRNLMQHQNLQLPKYDYDLVKEFFISMELPYYYTAPDGLVVGIENGQWVKKEFSQWFHKSPTSTEYWDDSELLVFIDSVPVDDNGNTTIVNGIPVITETCYPRSPSDPKAKYATIKEQGNGLHTRGAYFLNTDIEFSGAGSAPQSSTITKDGQPYVLNPDRQSVSSVKVSHNGLLYSWGKLQNSANRTVYGSVFAEGGFGAGGGPDVYYNYRMKNGSWINLTNSAVMRTAWRVRLEPIPDIS